MKKKLVSLTLFLVALLTLSASVQATVYEPDEKVQADYTCSGAPTNCWVIVVH